MKGISTIVAVLLLVILTIGLVATASGFIFGWFGARTAVLLEIDGEPYCTPGATMNAITIWVRNSGTSTSGTLTGVDVPGNPPGSPITGCTFSPTTLKPGEVSTATCGRALAGAGFWRVRISAPGAAPITARVYCSS